MIDIADVDPRVSRVLDIKTPGSMEVHRNLWSNLPLLTPHDQVKFVICSREDYEWARDIVAQHGGCTPAQAKDFVADLKAKGRYQADVY